MLPRVEQALDAVGIPDPETHCVCIRCGKWFKPDQGSWVALEGRFARNYSLSTGVGGRFGAPAAPEFAVSLTTGFGPPSLGCFCWSGYSRPSG
jgi:hypothetical protein